MPNDNNDSDTEILTDKPDLEFFTPDYPRDPTIGDPNWRMLFRLDDGRLLALHTGRKSRDIMFGMLIADCHDSGEPEPV